MKLTYNKKEDLLKALEGKRKVCKRIDAAEKRKRKKEKDKGFREMQKLLKEASKWSSDKWAKEQYILRLDYKKQPKSYCVRSLENMLDRALVELTATSQQRFTISDAGMYRDIYRVLTADIPDKKTICD